MTINPATNRIIGQSYDANGNVTVDPETGATRSYDFENRVTGSSVQYDRQNRILTTDSISYTFYGLAGEKLAVLQGTARIRRHLYFAGRLIGIEGRNAQGTLLSPAPVTLDRLGSVRQIGISPQSRYFPYGEPKEIAPSSLFYASAPQYATYEPLNSATSQTYDAWNRTYSAQQGRFLSPDPYQASGGPADPSSWNRYSYVHNNPVNYVDRRGLWITEPDEWEHPIAWPEDLPPFPIYPLPSPEPIERNDFLPNGADIGKRDALQALEKDACWQLLGYANAQAALQRFNNITFYSANDGAVRVRPDGGVETKPAPARTSGLGTIWINADYNWDDFSKTPKQGGGTYDYLGAFNRGLTEWGRANRSSVRALSTRELAALIIIHEVKHNSPKSHSTEDLAEAFQIYDNCIK